MERKERYWQVGEYRRTKYNVHGDLSAESLEMVADMIESGDSKDKDLQSWHEAYQLEMENWKEKQGISNRKAGKSVKFSCKNQ